MNNLGDITTIKLCGNKEIYNNILLLLFIFIIYLYIIIL